MLEEWTLMMKSWEDSYAIMDYARFNYIAQPGDEGVALMPDIGVYDKYAIKWGYKPILDKTAEEEKSTLDSWILAHAGDPLYRFGHQQVGHVSNNVGGVYEHYKTYDQEGVVYTPVDKTHQANCMAFIQKELFKTPAWLLDQDIFGRTQYSGFVERIRAIQVRTLNNMLSLGKMARLIENETANGSNAYSLLTMMSDLRKGIWSELPSGRKIDTYRRNLQKAHIDRLAYLMTAENQGKKPDFGGYQKSTVVNTSQSDIRSLARAELNILKRTIKNAISRTSDRMSKYHLQDAVERITMILDPK